MKLTLIPLMGPFHLRYPLYNVVSVRDTLKAFRPDALAVTALAPGSLEESGWQDTPEVALPHTVIPWARSQGVAVHEVFAPSPDPKAQRDFRRYAQDYAQLGTVLSQGDALLRPLNDLLGEGLTLKRILDEVVPTLKAQQLFLEERLEDGPGTDWLRQRVNTMAERILGVGAARIAVLASVDHLPFLQDALTGKAELTEPPYVPPSGETRERSLLDFAFRTDVPNPAELIGKLRTLDTPEARYHEANLLTANGHVAEALATLLDATKGNFSEPYFLPGYLLARLAQLHDLAGERGAALRNYRGVLALEYAPTEARQAAESGLQHSFEGL